MSESIKDSEFECPICNYKLSGQMYWASDKQSLCPKCGEKSGIYIYEYFLKTESNMI